MAEGTVVGMELADDVGGGVADLALGRMLDGVVVAAARMAGGLLDMAGDALLGARGVDDIAYGNTGADTGLPG